MASHEGTEPRLAAFRATVSGDGQPGLIEERAGRRLLRVLDPHSEEGAKLLRSGEVEILGPWGESFGRVGVEEAWSRLASRLEARLATEPTADEHLLEGLRRLRQPLAGLLP